jgi:hypothetical protein
MGHFSMEIDAPTGSNLNGNQHDVRCEWFSLGDVVDLSFGQRHFQWIAKRIDNDMDLCCQPAA